MDNDSLKGRIIGTLVIGGVALAVFVSIGSRLPAAPAPTPTPPPTPTPLRADALHAVLATPPSAPTITVGATATIEMTFKNTGTATWTKGAASEVRLGVVNEDTTFSSSGMAVGWVLPTRPAAQQETSVAPGTTATFSFQVKGVKAGSYKLALRPVVEGIAWLEDPNLVVTVTVK